MKSKTVDRLLKTIPDWIKDKVDNDVELYLSIIKNNKMATTTKGNVIVENIKMGDIHYEFEYGFGIKSKVVTLPIRDDNGKWTWTNEHISTGEPINYVVCEGMSHYAPNLYDYEAYKINKWI